MRGVDKVLAGYNDLGIRRETWNGGYGQEGDHQAAAQLHLCPSAFNQNDH
jgi:hypothetical protein